MKTILLIRHGMTRGNSEKRYIGRTDEPLCSVGLAQARQLFASGLPPCDAVFISPLLRCRQTCAILFPGVRPQIIDNLCECDFGLFEGKTADELRDDPAYNAWLAASCLTPIPNGESFPDFAARCRNAFTDATEALPDKATAAFVIHGGCMMAILERFAKPSRAYYEYHVDNCACVRCRFDGDVLCIGDGLPC